jgi:hypothetical protein
MLQSERDLITGDWSKPLKECSCKKNDGKCPEYRNKETGLPMEEAKMKLPENIWCLVPVAIFVLALVWRHFQ